MASRVADVALNDSLLNQSVARALRFERDHSGMTLQQVADASGIPLDTVQRYFRGKFEMKVGMLTAICGAMKVTPAAVFKRAFDEAKGGEEAIYADLRERFGVDVSEGGAKVTDIDAKRAAAEKLTAEDAENARVNRRAAASEDDDATRDEPEGP